MKKFTMTLDKKLQCPIAYLYNWHEIDAMIDTGSIFPVWIEAEELLLDLGATRLNNHVTFSGFGGKAEGSLYDIPVFQFGELIYPHFHIIVHRIMLPCQMILPATMFDHLRYEIDNENHLFNVTIPDKQSNVRNLVIKDEDGKLHVFCTPADFD